jgi:WD40 repeat protein
VSEPEGAARLDPQNPWPGLVSFREEESGFFFGREEETEAVLRLLLRERLAVLFGKSGLGKTSLLRAGVFPRLRGQGILPVYIRLDYKDPAPLTAQVRQAIEKAAAERGVECPAAHPGETLWELFHRREAFFWDAENQVVVPLLAFDQLEEMFSRGGERADDVRAFVHELGDLVEGRIPEAVKSRADSADAFDVDRHDSRVLLSLREDYLADLDGLRSELRSIAVNRFRLRRMNGDNALRAVRLAGKSLVDDEVARQVVGFVAGESPDAQQEGGDLAGLRVEPALLSVFCRELNNERLARKAKRITADQLNRERSSKIIADFYERSVADQPAGVRAFIEEYLLTSSGDRDSAAWDNALAEPGVTPEVLDLLESRRLLRIEEVEGRRRIELTHDVLTKAVLASREERRHREKTAEAEARERKADQAAKRNLAIALWLAFLVVAGGVLLVMVFRQKQALFRQKQDLETAKQRVEEAKVAADDSLRKLNQANRDTRRALNRADVQQAAHFTETGHAAQALVALARAVRGDPEDSVARGLLFDLLLRRSWPLPVGALRHGDGAQPPGFSPDGRFAFAISPEHRLEVLRLATGVLSRPLSSSAVSWAAFGPRGERMVVAEGTVVRVWDTASGRPVGAPLAHPATVLWAVLSADGRVATADAQGLRLWDAASGRLLSGPLAHGGALIVCRFDAAGDRLATVAVDGVRVWDARSGALLSPPPAPGQRVTWADISPGADRAVTAATDGSVRLWSLAGRRVTGRPLAEAERVRSVAFSPDGRRLVTGSWDGTAQVWDAATGRPLLRRLPRHDDEILATALSPDGRLLLTGSGDGTARLWDAATGEPRSEPVHHDDAVAAVAFDPAGRRFLTASSDGARIWEVPADHGAPLVLPTSAPAASASFSPDGRLLVTTALSASGAAAPARVWDTRTGLAVGAPLRHKGRIRSAAFSPDGQRVVIASDDGTARVWDARTGLPTGPPLRHGKPVAAALFSPDGRFLATACEDGRARLWPGPAGAPEPSHVLQHDGPVRSIRFSRDGERVITASEDKTARIWNTRTGAPLTPPLVHPNVVLSAELGADGRQAVTVAGRVTYLWDAATGESTGTMVQTAGLVSAELDRRVFWIVTAAQDGTARVWSTWTLRPVGEPMRHPDPQGRRTLYAAHFSPDGKRVVTAAGNRTAGVWNATTGEPIGAPFQHGGEVRSAELSPDGQRLATASWDGKVRIWDVPTGSQEDAARLADLAEAVADVQGLDESAAQRLPALRRAAAAGPLAPFLTWFFADAATRGPSPFAPR